MAAFVDKISDALLRDEGQGWKIDLFVDETMKTEYVCYFCHNICKDAVELSCDVDHDDDSIQLYCQNCLTAIISSNDNQCPIDNHKNPKYTSLRRIKSKINKAKVLCPNSSAYQQRQLNKDYEKGNAVIDTLDEKEGLHNNINANNIEEKGCDFEGCLTDLIQHIAKCCETNLNSKEITAEIIKLLKKDINDLKSENTNIQNVINELKKANVNINQKYEQQKSEIITLRNNQSNMNQKYEQQNIQMNKLEKTIKSQDCDKKFAVLLQRIAKLENITKAQNELIASMVHEKKEEKRQNVEETNFDEWDNNKKANEFRIEKNVTYSTKSSWRSVFGKQVCRKPYKYHWKLKIVEKMKHIGNSWPPLVGVQQNNGQEKINNYFTSSGSGYAFIGGHAKLTTDGDYGIAYGEKWTEMDDVLDMYLDLEKLTLSFGINGKKYGVAHNVPEAEYKLALSLYDGRKVKMVSSSKS